MSSELNSELFKIIYFGGGAEQLYKIVGCSSAIDGNYNKYIFFDGDQNTGIPFPKLESLMLDELSTLYQLIERSIGIATNKVIPLDSDKTSHNSIEIMKKFIEWCSSQVHFLPEETPELLILKGIGKDISSMSGDDAKQYFLDEQEKMRKQFSSISDVDIAHIYKGQELQKIDLTDENFRKIEDLLISIIR